jgi:hypothetical protein
MHTRSQNDYSLVEAGISVVVASMPAAAKIWKRHIVPSSLYSFARSRFYAPKSAAIHSIPSDLKAAKANANKKQRWGLYSLPTFLRTNRSATRTHRTKSQQDLEQNMDQRFRVSLEKRLENLDESSLELNNLSGSIKER